MNDDIADMFFTYHPYITLRGAIHSSLETSRSSQRHYAEQEKKFRRDPVLTQLYGRIFA